MDGLLKHGDSIGEIGNSCNVFVDAEYSEMVSRPDDLFDEVRGGGALGVHLDLRAETGVNHKREVERLLGFRLKDFDFLRIAFFGNLESFRGKIGGGAIVLIEDADEHVDEIHFDLDGGAVLYGVVAGRSGGNRLTGFAFVCLRPRRTIRILLLWSTR